MAVVGCRIAGDLRAVGQVARYPRLGRDEYAVADFEVVDEADLSGEDAVLADRGAAGDADLGAEDRVGADFDRVADLHEVVDFRSAANARFTDGGAVDASARLNLDVVFDDRGARLRNLVVAAVGAAGEAESVGTDGHAVVQGDPVADARAAAHGDMGMGFEIVADRRIAFDHDVRAQHGVASDDDPGLDHRAGADRGVGADPRRVGNDRRGVDAERGSFGRMKQFERAGEIEIRICGKQQRRRAVSGGSLDENRGGPGLPRERGVFRVGEEGQFARSGFFQPRRAADFQIGVRRRAAAQSAAESGGEVAQFHRAAHSQYQASASCAKNMAGTAAAAR